MKYFIGFALLPIGFVLTCKILIGLGDHSSLRQMFSHEQEGKGNELMVANLFPMENFKEVQFRLQRSKNHFQDHLNGNVTRGTDYTAFQNPKRSQSPESFAFMKIAYLGVLCASPTPIRLVICFNPITMFNCIVV